MNLTRKQRDAVETLAWGMKHFGGLVTNNQCPRRVVMRLVEMGLAESIGSVIVCDGDGFTVEPERWREGFRLTTLGVSTNEMILEEYSRMTGVEQ